MTDINTSEATILEALNNKVDLASGGSQATTDYVVEWKNPTTDDPNWYRVYKSGWVEQGGIGTITGATGTISFPKTMSDTYYYANTISSRSTSGNYTTQITAKTVSSMTVRFNVGDSSTTDMLWEVKGIKA